MSFNPHGPLVYIDNDEDDHYLMRNALKALSLSNPLRFFTKARQALEYLKTTEEKPLVILCEMYMPAMNGLELQQRIAEDEVLRQKSIPFIFLTTSFHQELIRKAYEGTIQGFYQKPSEFEQYKETIDLIVRYWQRCLHPNNAP